MLRENVGFVVIQEVGNFFEWFKLPTGTHVTRDNDHKMTDQWYNTSPQRVAFILPHPTIIEY
jgi:hypothetical protein